MRTHCRLAPVRGPGRRPAGSPLSRAPAPQAHRGYLADVCRSLGIEDMMATIWSVYKVVHGFKVKTLPRTEVRFAPTLARAAPRPRGHRLAPNGTATRGAGDPAAALPQSRPDARARPQDEVTSKQVNSACSIALALAGAHRTGHEAPRGKNVAHILQATLMTCVARRRPAIRSSAQPPPPRRPHARRPAADAAARILLTPSTAASAPTTDRGRRRCPRASARSPTFWPSCAAWT